MKSKLKMIQEGASQVEILEASVEAASQIIESLPVDPHDMEVHFWCDHEDEEDEDEED